VFAAETEQTKVAVEFAKNLAARDYARAHSLLATELQARLSASDLERQFTGMISYGEGEATIVQAVTTLQDWPDKKPRDVEWVYVAIANDTYSEGITVVIARQGTQLVVSSIEWGRP